MEGDPRLGGMTNLELEKMIEAERENLRAAVLAEARHFDRRPRSGRKLEAWELREEEFEAEMLAIVERIEVLRSVLRA